MARAVSRKVDYGDVLIGVSRRSAIGETVRQGNLVLHVCYVVGLSRDTLMIRFVPGQRCGDRVPDGGIADRHKTEIVEALKNLRPYQKLSLGIRGGAQIFQGFNYFGFV